MALYVGALAALCGVLLFVLLNSFPENELSPWLSTEPPPVAWAWWLGWLVFFMAVAGFAERYTVKIGPAMEVSAGFLAYFLSAALLGPVASFVVAAAGQVWVFRRGEWLRNLCFVSSLALASGVSSSLYWAVAGLPDNLQVGYALGGIVAGTAFQLVNFALFIPVLWMRRGMKPLAIWREGFQPFLPFHLFFLAISLILVFIYHLETFQGTTERGLVFVLSFLPVLGLVFAFRNYARERELARRLERFSLQVVASMITAIDYMDNYTARHSAAVAQYSLDIAKLLELPDYQCNLAHLAGFLHDVGKISVPHHVLKSSESLSEEDWMKVQEHCEAGQHILEKMSEFQELSRIVLCHHERYDGRGYPRGLSGEDIPLISRIVCVADSYSAMISNRPYREGLSAGAARKELVVQTGKQFDPDVVVAFIQLLEGADEAYQLAQQVDFHLQFQRVKLLDIAA